MIETPRPDFAAPRSASGTNFTIAARLTPPIASAIATIAVRGEAAADIVLSCALLKTSTLLVDRVYFGTWPIETAGTDDRLAEQVVICRTAEDQVEIHCHGGQAVCRVILDRLEESGCRIVEAERWPSDYSCPFSRAAEQDLVQASTEKGAAVLLDQLNGALARAVRNICHDMESDRIQRAASGLTELQHWATLGLHLSRPWSVVLAGPPNVGKSSLLNAIAGTPQSIVHSRAGTTRDWISVQAVVAGWGFEFIDTAGIRTSRGIIEQAGVERAKQRIAEAELTLLVVDATVGWTSVHDTVVAACKQDHLVVWNKADLVPDVPPELQLRHSAVAASGLGDPGTGLLLDRLRSMLVPDEPAPGTAVPFRQAQVAAVDAARCLLQSGDVGAAHEKLREML